MSPLRTSRRRRQAGARQPSLWPWRCCRSHSSPPACCWRRRAPDLVVVPLCFSYFRRFQPIHRDFLIARSQRGSSPVNLIHSVGRGPHARQHEAAAAAARLVFSISLRLFPWKPLLIAKNDGQQSEGQEGGARHAFVVVAGSRPPRLVCRRARTQPATMPAAPPAQAALALLLLASAAAAAAAASDADACPAAPWR